MFGFFRLTLLDNQARILLRYSQHPMLIIWHPANRVIDSRKPDRPVNSVTNIFPLSMLLHHLCKKASRECFVRGLCENCIDILKKYC